jgi:hypothetical protein
MDLISCMGGEVIHKSTIVWIFPKFLRVVFISEPVQVRNVFPVQRGRWRLEAPDTFRIYIQFPVWEAVIQLQESFKVHTYRIVSILNNGYLAYFSKNKVSPFTTIFLVEFSMSLYPSTYSFAAFNKATKPSLILPLLSQKAASTLVSVSSMSPG